MNTKILVVDDDVFLAKLLKHYLAEEGYTVDIACSGSEMYECIGENGVPYDLIILDLLLPDTDGITLAREIRRSSDVPIIMLTGKNDSIEKIVALEVGADDYVTKPFEERELLARIRSILRRVGHASNKPELNSNNETSTTSILDFDGWHLNLSNYTLLSPTQQEIELTSYEFQLLEIFARHPNRVLGREFLLDSLSGKEHSPFDRSIDVLVAKLRKKIEEDCNNPSMIKTIRGAGYKFMVTVNTVT